MGVRPRAVAPLHKALQVVVVCPAGHRDLAGARELANAITAEEIFHGVTPQTHIESGFQK